MDFISANTTNNVTSFEPSVGDSVMASLQILPGQSNYSMLLDSTIYDSPSYDVVRQNAAASKGDVDKKKHFDSITTFYLGALTVVGLLIVFRMTYKNVL